MAYHRQQGVDTCDRPHLQHVRPAHAPARRARDPELHPPGARERAADGLRRRLADAKLLLRRRPDPRARPARRERGAPAGEHRQPGRVHDPRARAEGDQGDRLDERDRLRGAAGRRPAGAPARHHPRPAGARLGAGDPARGRPAADAAVATGASQSVSKRVVRLAATLAVAAGLAVPAATASPSSMHDRHQRRGRRRSTATRPDAFATLRRCTSGAPRQPLLGRQVGVAKTRPSDATDPRRRRLRLVALRPRRRVRDANGIKVVFSILVTPGWANGGKARTVPPKNYERPARLRLRGRRALQRPRTPAHGRADAARPVRLWTAWNEPNNPVFLRAAVRQARRQVGDPERDRLREDLQRGLQRASTRRMLPERAGRVRRHRRRAGTTTRRARVRRSRRSRS